MKKKILSLILAICMIVPLSFSLVACDNNDDDTTTADPTSTTTAQSSVVLGYATTVYDGTAKTPTVFVKKGDTIVSEDNYTVTYSNNINAGTATVVVTAKTGNTVLGENYSVTKTFEIQRAPIEVSSFNALTSAIEVTDANHLIKLTNNIEMVKDADGKVKSVIFFPENEDKDIEIDLAGYDINSYFAITSKKGTTTTDKNLKLSVYNSSNEESIVGTNDNSINYAISLTTGNPYEMNFENITFKAYWGGLYSNGSYSTEATFTAKDCKFVSTYIDCPTNDASIGAYMASGKVTYRYDSCVFEGFGGYYAKSGHHYFVDCTVRAKGDQAFDIGHYGNGCYVTGSALMIDSCVGYNTIPASGYQKALTVDISGGQFISKAKNAIEEFSTYKDSNDRLSYAFVNIVDNATLVSGEGYNALSFENAEAYHSHVYTNDADSICNECGAIRKVAGRDLWNGHLGVLSEDVENVISISTGEQLYAFSKAVNGGNRYVGYTIELTNDIDLNNIEWTPIGSGSGAGSNSFGGTFDGKGYTIYNLKVTSFIGGAGNKKCATGVGLFGNVDHPAIIKNVNIVNAKVNGNHFVGALAGFASYATIENCSVENAVINCTHFDNDEDGDKAGVLIGHGSNVIIRNCSAENAKVKADRDAGQVIGCLAGVSTYEDVTATAVIVSANGTSTGANIKNEIVGRDTRSNI